MSQRELEVEGELPFLLFAIYSPTPPKDAARHEVLEVDPASVGWVLDKSIVRDLSSRFVFVAARTPATTAADIVSDKDPIADMLVLFPASLRCWYSSMTVPL